MKILVSACLLGQMVRYDGGTCAIVSGILQRWLEEGLVIPFCPEVAGGLPVPRPPAEVRGAGGEAVLDGAGQVVTKAGTDVTQAFLRGACSAVEVARTGEAPLAILKDDSPSCGCYTIHDGSFSGRRIPGQGVTAALLRRSGIAVFSEQELTTARELLDHLASPSGA